MLFSFSHRPFAGSEMLASSHWNNRPDKLPWLQDPTTHFKVTNRLHDFLSVFFPIHVRGQSFTSLNENLCQDIINGAFVFGRCLITAHK